MNRRPQLDALRGFALLGIALGNVLWFSGVAVTPPHGTSPALDDAVTFALHVLVEGKFYALFSLLFGASFAHMIRNEADAGRPPLARVRRRLGSLFTLGVAHATLVWFGDILSLYAVAALPLYALAHRRDDALLRWAVMLLLAPAALGVALAWWPYPAQLALPGYGPDAQLWAFAAGDYLDLLEANAAFLAQRWMLALASGRLPRLLGMFVLGLLWVRAEPRVRRGGHVLLWAVAVPSNLGLALLAEVPTLPPTPAGAWQSVVSSLAIPSGCLAYLTLLWPLFRRPSWARAALVAAGRLSLTHYLSQSLFFAGLFYGVGLGLWAQLSTTSAVALGGALAVLQILASRSWLERFGAGPGERVLRAADRAFAAHPPRPREEDPTRPSTRDSRIIESACDLRRTVTDSDGQ